MRTRIRPSGLAAGWCPAPLGLLLFLLAPLPFWPALGGSEFVFDDGPALRRNPDVIGPLNLTRLWTHDFWGDPLTSPTSHKSYRPLTVLALHALRYAGRGRMAVFRTANLALHALNSVLVGRVARQWLPTGEKLDFFAGWLFAWHPVHVESVVAGVGLADLAYSAVCLLALLAWGRTWSGSRLLLIGVVTGGAVLLKETGIMLPALLCASGWLHHPQVGHSPIWVRPIRDYVPRSLALLGVTGLVLYLRLWCMNFESPTFQTEDNPTIFMDSGLFRALNHAYHHAWHAWLLLFPDCLCFDWSMGCLALIESVWDGRVALVAGFELGLALLIAFGLARSHTHLGRGLLISLAFLMLPFLPAANIFFNVGFVIADRNLYLPCLGYCVLVPLTFAYIPNVWFRRRKRSLLLGLTAVFFLKSWQRSFDWTTELDLFQSGLRVCPRNAKIHYNLGKRLADQDQDSLALQAYETALALHPTYEHALNNLGNLYRKLKQHDKAIIALEQAVTINPDFAAAWMNLGVTQAQLQRLEAAEKSYKLALRHRPAYPDCFFNLGNLYLKSGQLLEAVGSFEQALALKENHKAAWSNLILLNDDLNRGEEAERLAQLAIAKFPAEADFQFHLANIYGKLNRFEDAELHFLYALALSDHPTHGLYHSNLGVLYHRWKKYKQAAHHYELALEIEPLNENTQGGSSRLWGVSLAKGPQFVCVPKSSSTRFHLRREGKEH
eukprot:snap_masked-scaffold2248_size18162-processed-gene-0.4 protein:Tk02689 transcript:snap_masked-scaffold2248_size18162-processed-gene-0.4-mRNA-1 annotation:"transmembrane and tpr repeat-containing protein 4-like"